MRLRVLDCKTISKMQRAKKLWYLGKHSSSCKFLFRARMDYGMHLQITKKPQDPLHIKTVNKNNQLPPSSGISSRLCHKPHVPEGLSLHLLPGLCSPLSFPILSFTQEAELSPQAAAHQSSQSNWISLAIYTSPGLKQQLPSISTTTCGVKSPHPFRLKQKGLSHPSVLTRPLRSDYH